MDKELPAKNSLDENFQVDYVILFRYANADESEAIRQFKKLVRTLADVGLQTEVRPGPDATLLVFVRTSEQSLRQAVRRSKVKDWLYGIRHAQPDTTEKPESEAERLLNVYHMITRTPEDGGAGISPKAGEWKLVDSIFPLHDNTINSQWIKNWSRKTFLSNDDLDQIRNRHGERVAFYFAFMQMYFGFLMVPAFFGFCCWALLGHFSLIYAVGNCIACLLFVELWKRQEADLAIRWQVKGVSAIKTKRRQFEYEEEVNDSVTGEKIQVFPATTRLWRQLLQIPFALVAVVALSTVIATCFAIEIFLSEVYTGPFKTYLVFIPTVLLSVFVPTISAALTFVATRLTDYENYETQDSYDAALTQKIFVLNFITSYLPVFLTAFVYVPFGSIIVPYLDIFGLTKPTAGKGKVQSSAPARFSIDPSRLRKQVIYFTVTAQIVNQGLENVLPYVKQKLFRKYKEYSEEKKNSQSPRSPRAEAVLNDAPGEVDFLTRVRNEAELSEYDVTADLREMCVQFGYLALFSPVWPLVPVSFLVNNWIELRSDFVKICTQCRRPTPFRADTIGPWLDSLSFLSWLGSITSAALVYMFCNDGLGPDGTPAQITGWVLLLCIFFSEHLYLLGRYAAQVVISKIETPASRKEKAQRYLVRKGYLDSITASSTPQSPSKRTSWSSRPATPPETEPADYRSSNAAGSLRSRMSDNISHPVGRRRSSLSVTDQEEIIRREEAKLAGPGSREQPPPETIGSSQRGRISRVSLEEDARKFSLHDTSPGDMFWARQKGWTETAQVGVGIMQAVAEVGVEDKKTK